MSKYLTGVIIGILSVMFSLLVRESFTSDTWLLFASVGVVDFIFIYVFFYSNTETEKVRWACTILAFAMVFSFLSSIILFICQHGLVSPFFFPLEVVIFLYPIISIVASTLILLVTSLPDVKMEMVDDLFWPRFAGDFRRAFDVTRLQNSKKGAF